MITQLISTNANLIRVNDQIFGKEVKSKVIGTKYITVTFTDDKKKKFLIEEEVDVVRWVFTDEEIAQQKRETALHRLNQVFAADETPRHRSLTEKALNNFADRPSSDLFNYSDIEEILQAQVIWGSKQEVIGYKELFMHRGANEGDALIAAYHVVVVLRGTELARRSASPLSRSTSVISNILDDLNSWSYSWLKNECKWFVSDEMSAAVYATVKELNK